MKRRFCALFGGNPPKLSPEKAVNSRVTAADLMMDRPIYPAIEKNPCFDPAGFVGGAIFHIDELWLF
jgi:hypothetical protein